MAVENLKFVVGADVNEMLNALTQSKKSLGDFKDQLSRFKASLETATDPKSIIRLNAAIEASQAKIRTLSTAGTSASTGLGKLQNSSNSATTALGNLGRVAQDAPFGFIGIANNLNPLLESFQRLKTEAGGGGNALKALASSLGGAGGLGLALSLGTAALTLMTTGFGAWTRGMGGAKESLSGLHKELSVFTEEVESSKNRIEGLNKELENTRRLADVNLRINIGDDFKRSIVSLQQQFIDQGGVTQTLKKEVEGLSTVAGQAFNKFLGEASEGARDLYKQFGDVLRIPSALVDELDKSDKALLQATQETSKALTDTQNKLTDSREKEVLIGRQNLATRVEEKRRLDEIAAAEAKRLANLPSVGKALKELGNELRALNAIGLTLGEDSTDERLAAVLSTIKKLIRDFKLSPDDTIIKKLLGDLPQNIFGNTLFDLNQNVNILLSRVNVAKQIEESVKKLHEDIKMTKVGPVDITVPVVPSISIPPESLKKMGEDLQHGISPILESAAENALSSLGESIGEALAGNVDTFADFFKPLFKALAGGIKQLGQYLIQMNTLVLLARRISFKNPIAGIAVGLALTALGSLIESKLNNTRAFAGGTRYAPGGQALVGERGAELITLPRGASVTPAAQTAAQLNGREVYIPEMRIRGADIYVSYNRAAQTMGRNG